MREQVFVDNYEGKNLRIQILLFCELRNKVTKFVTKKNSPFLRFLIGIIKSTVRLREKFLNRKNRGSSSTILFHSPIC